MSLKKEMLEEPNHIDELFNDFLHDYEENVPHFIWNNVKDELNARKKIRILQRLRTIAASVALLAAFGLGYYISNPGTIKKIKTVADTGHKLLIEDKTNKGDSLELKEEGAIKKQENPQNNELSLSNSINTNHTPATDYEKLGVFDSSYLFRKYNYVISLFKEKNTEQKKSFLAVSEQQSNQLLTDTLLLRKENLHSEDFPSLKENNKKLSAWSFGTKFSPIFSVEEGSTVQAEQTQGVKSGIDQGPDLKPDEKAITSFTGGININYRLNDRISFESGIFYLNKKQSADNLIASQNNEFGNGDFIVHTPGQSIDLQDIGDAHIIKQSYSTSYYNLNASFIANAEYIELPLIIRYKLVNQKLGLDVLSGVSTNFLVGNNSYILSGDNKLWSDNSELSSVLYGATVGLGINYKFYQNFSFNLEPTFKYSFLPENSIFRKYPYSFAVFAGFSYRFK
ncbi:MAG: PorT family protein [Bacteroidales bacterium]|nr:PorT family protein [Bacteroidales bacterium]